SRWLEAVGSRRGVGDREIVASHAEQACLFAREMGLEDAPALASRAFLMLLAAATSSRDRADYHGSRALFQRAAAIGEATDVDPALLIEARGYAATSRLRLEGSPEALAQLEGVLNDARRLGPSPVLANLLWWSAMYAMPVDAALARSRHLESITIARAAGDPATVAAALRQSAAPAAARGGQRPGIARRRGARCLCVRRRAARAWTDGALARRDPRRLRRRPRKCRKDHLCPAAHRARSHAARTW